MGTTAAMALVFAGCCTSVVFLELLITAEPGSGHIITFALFLFISLEGLVFTSRFGSQPNVIPIRDYLVLVVMFFLVNVSNNIAFKFRISMPLHIIFRSGGLTANLILGWLVLGRYYSISKCVSVIIISAGTLMATLASAQVTKDKEGGSEDIGVSAFLTGVSLLTFALFMSARMGIYQECLYKNHGKHAREALFYIHVLSMPGFLLTYSSIAEHVDKFNASPPLESLAALPVLVKMPKLWIFLMAHTLTQYMCISSVFSLTTCCSSLTVTLVLTLRKFLSLIFSLIYFKNPFTFSHWFGTALVFTGTLLFSDVPGKLWEWKGKEVEKMKGQGKKRREEWDEEGREVKKMEGEKRGEESDGEGRAVEEIKGKKKQIKGEGREEKRREEEREKAKGERCNKARKRKFEERKIY